MSTLAIIAIGVIALTLIPALILIKPATSGALATGSIEGVSAEQGPGVPAPPKPASRAQRGAFHVELPKQQSVEAPIDFEPTRQKSRASSTPYSGQFRRFMLRPQPEKPRHYVPHCDGFADVPLSFTDGKGSHYTTRWRLCIN